MKKILILASLALGMGLNGGAQAEVIGAGLSLQELSVAEKSADQWNDNLAKEYVPLVNYGRIWESYSLSWSRGPVKYMKFDGTEEINGKTYHRIVTFKETLLDGGKVKDDGNVYPMDVYEIEGYVREEDRKVYALVVGYVEGSTFTGMPYYPNNPYPDLEMSEQLIYDFACEEGNSFSAFACSEVGGYIFDFSVDSRSMESVDGEDCMKYKLSVTIKDDKHSYDCGWIEVLEGVGPIERGCLIFNEFYYAPTKPEFYNYLNRVFDKDGKLLYESPEGLDLIDLPMEGVFSSVSTVARPDVLHIYNDCVSYGEEGIAGKVCIYDLSGGCVKSVAGMGKLVISLAGLQQGVYVAVASPEGGAEVRRKFVVR